MFRFSGTAFLLSTLPSVLLLARTLFVGSNTMSIGPNQRNARHSISRRTARRQERAGVAARNTGTRTPPPPPPPLLLLLPHLLLPLLLLLEKLLPLHGASAQQSHFCRATSSLVVFNSAAVQPLSTSRVLNISATRSRTSFPTTAL